MIIGPLLGGSLAHFMGYRFIFFWTGFFCLGGGFVVIKYVKENFIRKGERKGSGVIQNLRYVFGASQLRFLLLLLIMVQFSLMFVAPFLSLYVEFLKFPAEYVGLMTGFVFGITGVTNAATAPFWGKRGDRVGYRKILRYSLAGMTLFYLPHAFVTNAYQLLILRAGLGIFVAGVLPTINSIVQRSTPEKDRGGIYGIFQSALLVGNTAGPLLGGLMAAYLGLRAIFLITTGIFFLAVIWERKTNQEQKSPP